MSIRAFRIIALLGILAIAAVPNVADAQVLYGSLTGNVTDPSGGSVPNAKVGVSNVATGVTKETVTDDRGVYLLSDLQAGTYKVTITRGIWQHGHVGSAGCAEHGPPRGRATGSGSVGQTVNVAADTTVLQTDRADVNHQISAEEVTDLPTMGTNGSRNFESVFIDDSGVQPAGSRDFDSGESFGGADILRERRLQYEQQPEARWRERRLSLAAPHRGLHSAIGRHPDGERGDQQLRCGTGAMQPGRPSTPSSNRAPTKFTARRGSTTRTAR